MNSYIVHSLKDDKILAVGNAKECTKQLDYANVDSFYSQLCAQRHRGKAGYPRRNKNIIITVIEK